MKYFGVLFAFLLAFQGVEGQSFEMNGTDTINKVDVNRKRQGYWMVKAKPPKFRNYPVGNLVEEGSYVNSRKEGLWKKYYPSAKLWSEITYKGSRPFGKYTLYYENGKTEEAGNWERTKNTGEFKRYHPNGKIAQEFSFTASGKRTGKQVYYYPNGKKRLEGTWNDGLESGEQKEYFENGDLMSVKNFDNGVMDKSSFETYAPKTAQVDALDNMIDAGKEMNVKVEKDEKPNQGAFDGNGYKKLFNSDRQIAKDGTFKNYRLMDGKQYKYDQNGLLTQIMIFKQGKYVGDGVIEEGM